MKEIVCLACSIFRKEIEGLKKRDKIDIPFIFLDSMLHMEPDKLDRRLRSIIEKERDKGNKIILLYGDCSPGICDFEGDDIKRTHAVNCIEIILGKEVYKDLLKKGAFFLMPEWTKRWQKIFKIHLGLDAEKGKLLMTDLHKELVYLDTGFEDIPHKTLREISEYTGLPWRILKVSSDNLSDKIIEIIKKL